MTYDDCEAYEVAEAEERAGRLYAQWHALSERLAVRPSALPDSELEALERRLEAVASRLRLAEEDLVAGVEVKTAPIYRELGEIRRALEGTGDVKPKLDA